MFGERRRNWLCKSVLMGNECGEVSKAEAYHRKPQLKHTTRSHANNRSPRCPRENSQLGNTIGRVELMGSNVRRADIPLSFSPSLLPSGATNNKRVTTYLRRSISGQPLVWYRVCSRPERVEVGLCLSVSRIIFISIAAVVS